MRKYFFLMLGALLPIMALALVSPLQAISLEQLARNATGLFGNGGPNQRAYTPTEADCVNYFCVDADQLPSTVLPAGFRNDQSGTHAAYCEQWAAEQYNITKARFPSATERCAQVYDAHTLYLMNALPQDERTRLADSLEQCDSLNRRDTNQCAHESIYCANILCTDRYSALPDLIASETPYCTSLLNDRIGMAHDCASIRGRYIADSREYRSSSRSMTTHDRIDCVENLCGVARFSLQGDDLDRCGYWLTEWDSVPMPQCQAAVDRLIYFYDGSLNRDTFDIIYTRGRLNDYLPDSGHISNSGPLGSDLSENIQSGRDYILSQMDDSQILECIDVLTSGQRFNVDPQVRYRCEVIGEYLGFFSITPDFVHSCVFGEENRFRGVQGLFGQGAAPDVSGALDGLFSAFGNAMNDRPAPAISPAAFREWQCAYVVASGQAESAVEDALGTGGLQQVAAAQDAWRNGVLNATDLTIDSVTFSDDGRTLRARIVTTGNALPENQVPFYVGLAYEGALYDQGDGTYFDIDMINELAERQDATTWTVQFPIPRELPRGTTQFRLLVDSQSDIDERNEGNNTWIGFSTPDYTVDGLQESDGEVRAVVRQRHHNLAAPMPPVEIRILGAQAGDERRLPATLEQQGDQTWSARVAIPQALATHVRVEVRVNPQQALREQDYTNNIETLSLAPDFQIAGVRIFRDVQQLIIENDSDAAWNAAVPVLVRYYSGEAITETQTVSVTQNTERQWIWEGRTPLVESIDAYDVIVNPDRAIAEIQYGNNFVWGPIGDAQDVSFLAGAVPPGERAESPEARNYEPAVLPGDFLYPFKSAGRKIRMAVTFSSPKKNTLRLRYANEKLVEADTLHTEGDTKRAFAHLLSQQDDLNHVGERLAAYKTEQELGQAIATVLRLERRAKQSQERVSAAADADALSDLYADEIQRDVQISNALKASQDGAVVAYIIAITPRELFASFDTFVTLQTVLTSKEAGVMQVRQLASQLAKRIEQLADADRTQFVEHIKNTPSLCLDQLSALATLETFVAPSDEQAFSDIMKELTAYCENQYAELPQTQDLQDAVQLLTTHMPALLRSLRALESPLAVSLLDERERTFVYSAVDRVREKQALPLPSLPEAEDTDTPPACVTDTDCDDAVTCTEDVCVQGACVHTAIDACGESEFDCGDGIDNDRNGKSDCDDTACTNASQCVTVEVPKDPYPACTTTFVCLKNTAGTKQTYAKTDTIPSGMQFDACGECVYDVAPAPKPTPTPTPTPKPEVSEPAPECTRNADCADSNSCTDDVCSNGTCVHTTYPSCGTIEYSCTDGIDNDRNGALDCADAACTNDPACAPKEPAPTTSPYDSCSDTDLICVMNGGNLESYMKSEIPSGATFQFCGSCFQ